MIKLFNSLTIMVLCEEIENVYQEIQNGIKYAKSDEVICIMGDLNAKVGDKRYPNM